jgi:hypothetical protein
MQIFATISLILRAAQGNGGRGDDGQLGCEASCDRISME